MGEIETFRSLPQWQKELCWVVFTRLISTRPKTFRTPCSAKARKSPSSQFWSCTVGTYQIMAANDYRHRSQRRGLPGFGMGGWRKSAATATRPVHARLPECHRQHFAEPYAGQRPLGMRGGQLPEATACTIWPGTTTDVSDPSSPCDGIFNAPCVLRSGRNAWFPSWDLGAGPWRKGISADPDNAERWTTSKVNPFTTSPHLYVDRCGCTSFASTARKITASSAHKGSRLSSAAVVNGIRRTLLYPDEPLGIETPKRHIVAAPFFLAGPLVEKIN